VPDQLASSSSPRSAHGVRVHARTAAAGGGGRVFTLHGFTPRLVGLGYTPNADGPDDTSLHSALRSQAVAGTLGLWGPGSTRSPANRSA
jgi:phosphoglucomutase